MQGPLRHIRHPLKIKEMIVHTSTTVQDSSAGLFLAQDSMLKIWTFGLPM